MMNLLKTTKTKGTIGLIGFSLIGATLSAQEFKKVTVNYTLKGKAMSNTIQIPQYPGSDQPPIRGVMQGARGPLTEFAHKNQVALFSRLDDGRGFSKELLAAAAKAAERPEIEFAGAIVQGISKGGREAADWAHANQKRAIAVILDHSAIWRMDFPKRVSGVPMFFNATYADMYQNIDRRKSHFEWNEAAYKAGQPCTSIIDFVKNGGHGGRGSTSLTALWLEEAMNFRVPANVPVGKPYQLVDVNPAKVGGYVSAKLSKDGKRTYHDNVKVTVKPSNSSWWIPGPKSAALYLDWVKQNGGKVDLDESANIKNAPVFLDLPRDLARAMELIADQKWATAYAILAKPDNQSDSFGKSLYTKVNAKVDEHIAMIKKQDRAGDTFGVYTSFHKFHSSFKGIPAYDKVFQEYKTFFVKEETKADVKIGREFHDIINKINKANIVNQGILAHVEKFMNANASNAHGKAAKRAHQAMSRDASTRQGPETYYLED